MADDDDDYLSDKFLTVAEPQKPKTYSDKRKDALRESLLRNEQNRIKSRRQLELESREEGLSKSLFERAEDDKASGRGPENKALSMMMKMGFKPGQGLGVPTDLEGGATVRDATPQHDDIPPQGTSIVQPEKHKRQLVNPLPLNEWSGRKGIGLGKRAPSPTELERLAKVAKATEEADKLSFRDRSRREFEQRRAEARLGPAQQTCATLDERAGKEFNVLWLDAANPDAFPTGLVDAINEIAAGEWSEGGECGRSMKERLRAQMQADALRPLGDDEDQPKNADTDPMPLPLGTIQEAAQFLLLDPVERLDCVLRYLRAEYHYCFWCGTQYKNSEEMQEECPGPDEDMHD